MWGRSKVSNSNKALSQCYCTCPLPRIHWGRIWEVSNTTTLRFGYEVHGINNSPHQPHTTLNELNVSWWSEVSHYTKGVVSGTAFNLWQGYMRSPHLEEKYRWRLLSQHNCNMRSMVSKTLHILQYPCKTLYNFVHTCQGIYSHVTRSMHLNQLN